MPGLPITKAVIPAAGLGTRFLPATKVVPKELLPIAGRPIIQYAIEEAAASGIQTVVLVVGPGKQLVRQHFDRDTALEEILASRGWESEAGEIRRLTEFVTIETVWQDKPIGLAHAISLAEPIIGKDPFAVILPDALIDAAVPCIRQLIECFLSHPGCLIATQAIHEHEVERFGIVETELSSTPESMVLRITSLLERPPADQTTSRLGVFGRYILLPEIFEFIRTLKPGRGGELQLTDALSACAQSLPVYAYQFCGEHFDVGSKTGFVEATVKYALKDPELAPLVREYLSSLDLWPRLPEVHSFALKRGL